MRLTADLRYDADPATVFEMLSDQAFQNRKLGQTGALSWEVQVQQNGTGVVITSRRALPTDHVPDAFKSLVGPQITIASTETWGPAAADGSRTGTMDLEVVGAPVGMKASLSLSATAEGGSIEQVDGELKARVPLIGGRIERTAEPAVRAAIDAEQRIGREWLAEKK